MQGMYSCPTEMGEPLTLPGNILLKDVGIAAAIFFIPSFIYPSLMNLILYLSLAFGYVSLKGMLNGYGPAGWMTHGLYWLEIGYKLRGFHKPYPIIHDVW